MASNTFDRERLPRQNKASRLAVAFIIVIIGCDVPPDSISGSPVDQNRNAMKRGMGPVTTITVSESVWSGRASLIEEASIGVDSGDDAYMFGSIQSLYATDDMILVLDSQIPALRAFDFEGKYIRDFGGTGQGPGEFLSPVLITGTPDGSIVLLDRTRPHSLNVYDSTGSLLEPYRVEALAYCCSRPFVVLHDGSLWIEIKPGSGPMIGGRAIQRYVQRIRRDGSADVPQAVPLLGFEPVTFELIDISFERLAPLAPEHLWALSATGDLIVGVSDAYEFEIHRPDGSVTRVIRDAEPVMTLGVEADWHRKSILGSYGWSPQGQRMNLRWDEVVPEYKPAYTEFVTAASGEIWLYRAGPSRLLEDCIVGPIRRQGHSRIPSPCHDEPMIVDVFDPEGLYLGEVEVPDGFRYIVPRPFVRDDLVVAAVWDDDGIQRVKRFRLVLPE